MSEEKKNNVDKCINCGMCNSNCPTYKATGNELYGPRGRALMINNKSVENSFYDCTLCDACEKDCPVNININLKKVREELVNKKEETEANKEMIKNIREHGNPFGELKEGEIPDKLYCC